MTEPLPAVVRQGHIELLEPLPLPEGTRLLIRLEPQGDDAFWLAAGEKSLEAVWGSPEDDVYAALLED